MIQYASNLLVSVFTRKPYFKVYFLAITVDTQQKTKKQNGCHVKILKVSASPLRALGRPLVPSRGQYTKTCFVVLLLLRNQS